MIVSPIRGGKNTKDATITPVDVSYGEIAYGKDGKVIGTSPIVHVDGIGLGEPNNYLAEGDWISICYGNGVYVIVESCKNGRIAYSTDGLNYEYVTSLQHAGIVEVCYGNGMFIAVSLDGYIFTSTNGIDWDVKQIEMTCFSVCYGTDKFVIIGDRRSAYSTDGVNWTIVDCPRKYIGSGFCLRRVCYGADKFVSVGYTGAVYSTDGINWQETTIPVEMQCEDICYANGMFIAPSRDKAYILYSTDGINWVDILIEGVAKFNSVCHDGSKFVAMGEIPGLVFYSSDGINWDYYLDNENSNITYCVRFINNKFYAVGSVLRTSELGIVYEPFVQEVQYFVGDVVQDLNGGIYLSHKDIESRKLIISDTELKFEGDYNTSDATIAAVDVGYGEVAYGENGKIEGLSAFKYFSGEGIVTMPLASWSCICYGDGKFVAACYSDTIAAYSHDGINWIATDMPNGSNRSLCYGGDKFVVVRYRNTASYSTDGLNWINTPMPATIDWQSVCYGDGKFVAVGSYDTNIAAYSTDGINWIQTTMPTNASWYSVCYGDGKFVAIARETGIAAYSTDGINWIQTTMPISAVWFSVCYGDGKFVAIACLSQIAAYSTDGINWTETTLPSYEEWGRVCYGNGKFVAISSVWGASSIAAYSEDGINWISSDLVTNTFWADICYGNELFIAIIDNSDGCAFSKDGIIWSSVSYTAEIVQDLLGGLYLTYNDIEPRKLIISNTELKFEGDYTTTDSTIESNKLMLNDIGYGINGKVVGTAPLSFVNEGEKFTISKLGWQSVCYGNGKYVAVSESSSTVAYSTDGTNWIRSTLPSYTNWRRVCYGNETFVAIAYNTNIAAYSTDGINWTQTTMPASLRWNSVCYGGDKFVAIANFTNIAAYSTDGINWTEITMPSDNWYSVTYGNDKFVAVGGSSIAAYSTDGINWIQTTMPNSLGWGSVCYGDGKFVAIAYNTNIAAYSTDGINWTSVEFAGSNEYGYNPVCYGNGVFVSFADGYDMAYSTDGIHWNYKTKLNFESYGQTFDYSGWNWYSICYGNGKFVAMAYNTNILICSNNGIDWFINNADTYQLKNTVAGMNITAEGCETRHIIVADNQILFEDEPTINAEEVEF